MFSYTKSTEVNPQKNKHMTMVQTFPFLWEVRRKNVALSTLLLLKLGVQMLHPYVIQTALNCVALKATGVHTNPQKDAIHQFKEE